MESQPRPLRTEEPTDAEITAASQKVFRLCALIRFLDTDSVHEDLIVEGFGFAEVMYATANGTPVPDEERFTGPDLQDWVDTAEAAIESMESRLVDRHDPIWLGMFNKDLGPEVDPEPEVVPEPARPVIPPPPGAPEPQDEAEVADPTLEPDGAPEAATEADPHDDDDENVDAEADREPEVVPDPPRPVIPPPPGAPVSVFASPEPIDTIDDHDTDTDPDTDPDPDSGSGPAAETPAPTFDPFNEHTPKHKKRKVRIWGTKR